MRKSLLTAAAFLAAALSASCFGVQAEADDKIQVVTTIFPEYDWVNTILGDNPASAEVTMLLDNGVDLHSYQPTTDDILKIATCDLFIYVGGESDDWVEDALKEAVNQDMVVINLLDALGDSVKEEELVEGMQEGEHEHHHDEDEDHEDEDHEDEDHEDEDHEDEDHDHEDQNHDDEEHEGEDHDHEEEDHEDEEHDHEHGDAEYDEHVWLSLRNTAALVDVICDALGSIDSGNATYYQENADAYKQELSALDEEYAAAVAEGSVDTLLFGDRFPFRYLTDDYGLSYYAAFSGCSAETEASFETIVFLAEKVDELSLHSIMTIEGTDHRIADVIVQATKTKDQQVLTLDSLQSVTGEDVQNGASYLDIMRSNLEVLKEALK